MRIGRFEASLFMDGEVIAGLGFTPVSAEVSEDRITHTALSDRFDDVPDGEPVPEYDVSFNHRAGGHVTVAAVERRTR